MKKLSREPRTWLVGDEARPVPAIFGVPQSVEVHVDACPRGLRLARRGVPVRVGGRLSRLEPHELGRVGGVSLHPEPIVAAATITKDNRLSQSSRSSANSCCGIPVGRIFVIDYFVIVLVKYNYIIDNIFE